MNQSNANLITEDINKPTAGKRLCIVIPMKNPLRSKKRLSSLLSGPQREALALTLFKRTLAFLTQQLLPSTGLLATTQHLQSAATSPVTAYGHIDILVVTPSQKIASIANQYGAQALIENSHRGLNHAVSQGARWSEEHGFDSQMILPADIVELDLDEFNLLLMQHLQQAGESITLCPASDGGTNALLTSPPRAITFAYGKDSCTKHQDAARDQAIPCALLRLPKLAFDLDTPADCQLITEEKSLSLPLDIHRHFSHVTAQVTSQNSAALFNRAALD